ncbi:hypothetical protein [Streptomyces lydicus]|uniref:WXG100-like domain-containing protein n=1 Tax=Streptomyces lydicus TaxID=47763 RepID=UPI0039A47A44
MSGRFGRGSNPINLHPDDLHSVALKFAKGQDRIIAIGKSLQSGLDGASGMAGNDDYGHKYAKKYDPAAKALFLTISGAVRAIGQASTALVQTANNYMKADHHSNPHAGKGGGPEQYSPPPVFTDVSISPPDSALGAGDSSMPEVLAKYWPNGHQDKLHAAAHAYRSAASAIDDLGNDLHQQVRSLTDSSSDDSIEAMAEFWGKIWRGGKGAGKAPLSAAKHACEQLANACEKFAQAIDSAHSETEHKLAEAGIAITVTTIVGVILTPFTGGGSDAAAAALDSAEAAAILGDVAVVLDESIATIGTEVISDLEIYLQSAADSVPEIEAVDADSTEVGNILERELADTEAREPAGVGGRGGHGGGKPPTGGHPPEDPTPGDGGMDGRDIHGAGRVGERGVDVDHVWQEGELYIQEDGQMVKILDNGNGTFDVVVRDPANPSGGPTTVLKNATQRYVDNKISKGIWE